MANKSYSTGSQLPANAPLKEADLASTEKKAAPGNNKNKKNNKEKKPNIFVRIGRVFKEMFNELKKVTWPSAKQTFSSLGVVLLVVLVFLLVTMGFDSLLSWLLKLLIQG